EPCVRAAVGRSIGLAAASNYQMGEGAAESEGGRMIRADEIHARLASTWPQVLVQLGIPETALRNRHGPCPACGGTDRFRFDNKHSRGDWFCNHCGGSNGPGA